MYKILCMDYRRAFANRSLNYFEKESFSTSKTALIHGMEVVILESFKEMR
jgi:hypothetical protein